MSEKPHLLILIGGHLSLGPRPQKEAAAVAAGFQVTMRGNWWDARLADEDQKLASEIGIDFAPLLDMCGGSGFFFRLKQRAAREWFRLTGIATARSFGNGAPEMLREATRLKPDLVMVHSKAGLWAGNQLLKKGFRVGVDFEDWFSEDLPEADRVGRPVQEKITAFEPQRPSLRTRIKAMVEGNAPWDLPEHWMTKAMTTAGMCRFEFTGEGAGMWSLHPPYRCPEFFEKLPDHVKMVESGDLPESQPGNHDVDTCLIDWTEARALIQQNRWWKRLLKR